MSLMQCGVGAGEKAGSSAVKAWAKGNPVVTLDVLQSLCCIIVFQQTELAAQQLPRQIWGCCRQTWPFASNSSRNMPESLVTVGAVAVKVLFKDSWDFSQADWRLAMKLPEMYAAGVIHNWNFVLCCFRVCWPSKESWPPSWCKWWKVPTWMVSWTVTVIPLAAVNTEWRHDCMKLCRRMLSSVKRIMKR